MQQAQKTVFPAKQGRWWWGVTLALVLAGCGSLPQPPRPIARYDLGAAVPVATQAQASAQAAPVALAPLQSPLLGDGSTAMRYRLTYADAQVLHAYSQARWSAPPASLVQQRLGEHLSQGGRVVLYADVGDALPSVQGQRVPVLRWSLEEFSQVFSAEQQSAAMIRLRATLVNPLPQGDVLLAQQVFTVQQPATAPNAAAGVQAMVQAVDTLGQQLVTWMDGVLQHQR